ncbi:hypothetical protein ASC94_24880 [Massilia sp. Root418]|uniref:SEL1-like repeat protein n=1 Tax=Massilia sp. Root418 TaxID=1736532 RepID=UPI0006F8D2E5|nr:SEL1-like repeat protein [Massilia sp. Root418]KQW88635.1 hypothetical protein ASC94_24880 [Massilia sp. Root418]
MKQNALALALLGIGIGLASPAHADLAGGLSAYKAGRCEEAIKTLTPVAEAGDAAAQKALGDLYLNDEERCRDKGRNVPAAETWYVLAARAGNVAAQRQLIDFYEYSYKTSNPVQATFWIARVAALGGASDLSRLATRHERAEGVPHDRVLAHAFNLLASQRVTKDDGGELAKAIERNAAEMSPEQLAEAAALASAWKAGTPLPEVSTTGQRDPRDWYKAAAEAGDIQAAHKAGTLYWKFGYGLKPQPEQAAFWLRKAAQGGIADAQYQLSQLYTMGYGVPKDYVLASALYRLAVKGGSKEAAAREDGWDEALTAQQLGERNALVASWKKGEAFPEATRYGMQRKVNYVDDAQGKLTPTPEVLALFKAASEGEEAEFTRLLARVDHVDDYLVENEKLLHALLRPAFSLREEAGTWREARKDTRDTAHWHAQQARHAALLPAKTRMLALALKRGAGVNEGTERDHAAPLHLAAMFGTPEMVRLLLKHGADPRQYGGQNKSLAPLEFALEQQEYGQGLPELITPEQRTGNILALLQAGALRPYIRYDERKRSKKDGEPKIERPFADYMMWPNALALTRGTAVLDALLKTGTAPAEDGEGKTCFDYAAEAGNADAIAWLKQRLPRYGKQKRDHWLDAAMLAMHSSAPGRDKVLAQLLVKGMDWSQQGPQEASFSRSHRTLYGGSARVGTGTLLNHATGARRLEWIPKLAALGAPVNTGGSVGQLVGAVRDNDIDSAQALLAQGADPLDGNESALEQALKDPAGKDAMLDLLLHHIVQVQKKSLVEIRPSPLEAALTQPDAISMPRVRKLLDAGASLEHLSRDAIDAAFAAPDRSLAALLVQRSAPAEAGEPRFLFFAIRTGRTDLLPSILARGEDPNQRTALRDGSAQPSAVDYAISQGRTEALAVLLAHGGVIDTSTVQPWGTALDRAVASLNADMLRMVSKDFTLPLQQACLKASAQLARVVLESPASYWSLLREHRFATGSTCAGIQERLALHLAETRGQLLEGWVGQQLAERLPQLGPGRESFGAGTWAAIAAGGNEPLVALLAKAGWQAPAGRHVVEEAEPQQDKAADLALQAKLPGHYYLTGVREVGAEILLRPDGTFEYSMAYGAVDEFAKGSWTVWNQQVVFRSETAPAPAAPLQPAAGAQAVSLPVGQVLVDLRYQGKSIPGFKVAVLGDAPLKSEGRTGAEGWRTAFSGPVRHIAVSHPEVNRSKWMVYAVPPADAQRGSYRLDFQPPADAQAGFNFTLDVQDGSLILERGGREMQFEKH